MHPTITIDIGTTSVKLCRFAADGSVTATTKHPTPTVADAWGEVYDTDLLEQQVRDFIGSLDPADRSTVRRVAVAGVGESGGLVRPDTTLASPMILWHDHRGAAFVDALSDADRDRVYAVTGLPANANYGISKTAWALRHTDAGAADGACWLNIAEFLTARLTGERWSEYSLASRTMALDLTTGTWSEEICNLFGVPVTVFPPLRAATSGAPITAEQAHLLGLDSAVEVHVAGHDHMVGALGADLHPGELLNSTGTTEGLLVLTDRPVLTPSAARSKLANGIDGTGSRYTLFASIPTGGSAFATLQHLVGVDADTLVDVIEQLHSRYVTGGIDLDRIPLVLPQFRGSPPPTKNARARGIIAGIATDTSVEEIVFGCFLGMVLQFQDVLNLFPTSTDQVKVIGPASSNALWQQLKADLLGTPLTASRFPEVVSRGAQALASDERPEWALSDPGDVAFDAGRHAALTAWCEQIRPQWQHLKGTPA